MPTRSALLVMLPCAALAACVAAPGGVDGAGAAAGARSPGATMRGARATRADAAGGAPAAAPLAGAPDPAAPEPAWRLLEADGGPGRDNADAWMLRLSLAAEALGDREPARALPLLEELLGHGDASAIASFLHGVALLHLGRFEESVASLRRAAELDPEDVSTRNVLARAYYENGQLDEAIAELEMAVRLDEQDAGSWTSLGLLHVEARSWDAAYDALLEAVRLDPESVEAHRGMGLLFASVGELGRAEQAYRQARRLAPDHLALTLGLAHVLRDQDRREEALELYRQAAEREPDLAVHAANVGTTLYEMGRVAAARPHLERALELADGGELEAAWVHLTLGRVLEHLGDVEGAAFEYESALELDPELGQAHEALGLIAVDRGESDRALRHLRAAFHSTGIAPATVVELVLLLEERGEREEARQCVRLLRGLEDDEPDVAFRLAQIQVRSNDPELRDPAAATAALAPLLDGDLAHDPGAWQLLAEALASQGRFEQALDALDRALATTDPDGPAWQRYQAQRAVYLSRVDEP